MGNGAVQAAISTVQAPPPRLPLPSEEVAEPPSRLTKGLLHRRQVLLANDRGVSNPFELLPPIVQLSRPAWEHHESKGDVACRRLGYEAIELLRKQAQVVQEADGLLGEYAIELLGLGLRTGSSLSKRLFQVAQVSLDESRPCRVSFYELIALQSILAGGTPEELEQLLFCIFDEDQDDLISAQDFASTVTAFSELKQEGDSACDAMSQQLQAKLMAEEVLEKYGSKVYVHRPHSRHAPFRAHADTVTSTTSTHAVSRRMLCSRGEKLTTADDADAGSVAPLQTRQSCSLCSCRTPLNEEEVDAASAGCFPCSHKKEVRDLVIAPLTFTQWQLWFQRFVSQSEVFGSVGLGDIFHTGHTG
mmetsp:Transcript_9307/g.16791  ORF Transcript_9307/g.16791 Transcript_9307/m.16791 type:complete len:360 (-) Transcript_9307:103-1182(-)